MITCHLILRNVAIYWKTLFAILYPVALLPVFVIKNSTETRCLYVVLLMAGYWVGEIFPLVITALIPMALFPTMGILDTTSTSMCYFKDNNLMFMGGLIIALAVEYSGLHNRISLHVIKCIGCSFRRLSFGLSTMTMLISMWISNTAVTAMMMPVIDALTKELEAQGLAPVYEQKKIPKGEAPLSPGGDESYLQPTNTTMCFHIGTAYAAIFGGMGCAVGSGTNLALRAVYETEFKNSPGVEFDKWLMNNAPMMLVMNFISWFYMQIWYMGLFRPNSVDGKRVKIGKEGSRLAENVIAGKLQALGTITFHEMLVALHFLLVVCLWFFLKPGFIRGWAAALTENQVGDATATMIVVLLLFMLPAKPEFIYMFSNNEGKRPKKRAGSLITWEYIQTKMRWGLVLLMGGGFAIAEGSKKSGMGVMLANQVVHLKNWNKYAILCTVCFCVMTITQFTSSVAVGNMLLYVAANVCRTAKIHPMYLMMPISLSCSAAFCLPVSTPPNAIARAACHMSTFEMIKVGVVTQLIFYVVLISMFPLLAPLVWPDIHSYPKWADMH